MDRSTSLRLAALLASQHDVTPSKLGIYPGVPLRTAFDVNAAMSASLHRHRWLAITGGEEEGDEEDDLDGDGFTVWQEAEVTEEMMEHAMCELDRQEREWKALTTGGLSHTARKREFWKGVCAFPTPPHRVTCNIVNDCACGRAGAREVRVRVKQVLGQVLHTKRDEVLP